MVTRTATVIGATGLIESHLVELLTRDGYFNAVRIIARRMPDRVPQGAEVRVIDFEDQDAFRSAVEGSFALFCAVGTTRKKVKGDMAAYRKVDHDIPVNAARHCHETGCGRYLMVSSVGASSKTGNFYLKFKGDAEDAIAATGIPSVSVFRPSMLMGKRNESRPAEAIAQVMMAPLSFLFPAKYKPIKGLDVAKAMVAAAKNDEKGFRVYHHTDMMNLIREQH
jgi:uncharacterized protein YbjT (DUF2867 family)